MGRKGEYPEWVMKHLEKGVYVNKVKGTYYLYRAHSEKQPGKKYPVRVFDGYIGKVTEDEGLVEIKRRKLPMESLDYALPYAVDRAATKYIRVYVSHIRGMALLYMYAKCKVSLWILFAEIVSVVVAFYSIPRINQ